MKSKLNGRKRKFLKEVNLKCFSKRKSKNINLRKS
jgi:hypothetical protein